MWKQSRCWYCLSVATLTVFTAIAPSLAKIYRVILVIWLTLSWHSPIHKHPVATPALDIISITPKGRNKTTVITIQHRPFLQRGGPSVGDGLMRAEILQTFLYSSLTCGARSRYRCVLGSFEALSLLLSDQDYLARLSQNPDQTTDQKSIKVKHHFSELKWRIRMTVIVNLGVLTINPEKNSILQPEVIYLERTDLVIMRISQNRFKYREDIFSFIC